MKNKTNSKRKEFFLSDYIIHKKNTEIKFGHNTNQIIVIKYSKSWVMTCYSFNEKCAKRITSNKFWSFVQAFSWRKREIDRCLRVTIHSYSLPRDRFVALKLSQLSHAQFQSGRIDFSHGNPWQSWCWDRTAQTIFWT